MKRNIDKFLLTVACAIPFLRLGIGEIQPWDESLYVIRADACIKFGAWLDQTKYAVGGLYSAWHPPLGIWLIAVSRYFLGNSALSTRLPMAIAASASVVFVWLIVRRFTFSSGPPLISAISLATADLFLTYSHRAQMESLILFFTLASIYTLVKSLDKESWKWSVASGILLGLGLMTKLGYALYVVPLVLLLPRAMDPYKEKPRLKRFVFGMLAVALCIPLPWFLMMINNHPGFVSYVADYLHTFRTGDYAPSSLAWWYYLNRLVVAFPLIVVSLFIYCIHRFRIPFTGAVVKWLLAVIILLQLVSTRMPHFAFLLVAPAALVIGSNWNGLMYTIWERMRYEGAKHFKLVFASLLIPILLLIGYSASEQIRMLLAGRLKGNEFYIAPSGMLAFGVSLYVGLFLTKYGGKYARIPGGFPSDTVRRNFGEGALKYATQETRALIGISSLLLAIAFAHIFSIQEKVYENGAEQVAMIANSLPAKSRIVVIHPDFPHEQYAPQLAYYTGGWTLGWLPGKQSQTFAWDSILQNYAPDSTHDIAVISGFRDRFNHTPASETMLLDSIHAKLGKGFGKMKVFRSYTVFY